MSQERALIQSAIQGDVSALESLIVRHRPAVLRIARHLLGDAETAEDVAQDAMLRLQSSLPGFRGDAELGTWLYRVTLNLCRDRQRSRRARAEHIPVTEAVDAPALRTESDSEARVDGERVRAAVRQAIERLPTDQKEVVMLRYIADLSYAEIARITGAPHGTVASRVFRALKRLGEDLGPKHLEMIP